MLIARRYRKIDILASLKRQGKDKDLDTIAWAVNLMCCELG